MSEWKIYTGSEEQIEEMRNAENGFVTSVTSPIWNKQVVPNRESVIKLMSEADKYLICNKHPLADMIERWARTGQPVWWRPKNSEIWGNASSWGCDYIPWHNPGYEFSFAPFEEEK